MAATYIDIQKETGLSLSTISKYFNGGNLRPQNKIAIENAIEKLDFHVNEFARGLKSKKSKIIGIIIPELNSTFHTEIIAEVEKILRLNGYGCIICDCRLNKKSEIDSIHFLIEKMVDGIIIVPFDKTGSQLKILKDRKIPFVSLDRVPTDIQCNCVITDNESAGEMAVSEFLKFGHEKIAMIGASKQIYTMSQRQQGFVQALKNRNIMPNNSYMLEYDMTIKGGYSATCKLLKMKNPPTAIFCANYEITLGTIIALNELDKKLNEDISIIGFDNLILSELIKPTLTLIVQPMELIAKNGAQLLLNLLESKDKDLPPKIIKLPLTIIKGNSIKKL